MKLIKKYYWLLAALFVFIIYQFTLAPSVVEIDSGELATVQALLGIAHPTGYPLFTLVGHLFYLIPLPLSKIYQLNLLASIWCSLGIGIFILNSKYILDNLSRFVNSNTQLKGKSKKGNTKPNKKNLPVISENIKIISSILAGLLLAFSKTFWDQSTSVEVYPLHIFLINLIILFLLRAYVNNRMKDWLIFSAVLALGFTNHMTTILIILAAAYLFFDNNKFKKDSFLKLAKMFPVFVLVLIIFYSYLVIRASQNPILNWGNPSNLERLFRHISGAQYRVWMFSSFASAGKQLNYFITNLPSEFGISLFIIFIGILFAYKYSTKLLIFFTIAFFTTILYSINYDIHDIDSYFLLAYISLSYISLFGILEITKLLKFRKKYTVVPLTLIAVFVVIESYYNFAKVDQHDNYIFQDYAKAVLNSVPKNSIIFTYEWDYLVSESYYFRYVENYRRDVVVIDKELLRRSWYYVQLQRNYPSAVSGIQDLTLEFKKALKPFEEGGNYNSSLLESLYRAIMTNLVATNINKRNFYIAPELVENEMRRGKFTLPKGYKLVPDLLLFKVVKGDSYSPANNPNFTIKVPQNQNAYTKFIERNVATMLERRALYEIGFDKLDKARKYISKVKTTFPSFQLPEELLKTLGE